MYTTNTTPQRCNKCNQETSTFQCQGCRLSFCNHHMTEHQKEMYIQTNAIFEQNNSLKQKVDERNCDESLIKKIKQWEKDSIQKIQNMAKEAQNYLEQLLKESKYRWMNMIQKLSTEILYSQSSKTITENNLDRWMKQIQDLKTELELPLKAEVSYDDDSNFIRLIKIRNLEKADNSSNNSSYKTAAETQNNSGKTTPITHSPSREAKLSDESQVSDPKNEACSLSSSYSCLTFGVNSSTDHTIKKLFGSLMKLEPMDKNGPMSGRCAAQTDQMEGFLQRAFGFENIPGKSIVQGVKAFKLHMDVGKLPPNKIIYFPSPTDQQRFAMSVSEINEWQSSYKVYADKDVKKITKDFLQRALKGKSADGEEAFYMKFVVRISTCPILMEFDAKVIPRELHENWPHRIKLVSVTGIDFAGRKHDVGDILCYLSNWKEVFEIDHAKNEPALLNDRDFRIRKDVQPSKLDEQRLLTDLKRMARLRLRACDAEGVEIVVETGIGLGIFAGEHIGVDHTVRISSAVAIRSILEEEGPKYKHIRAIVFSLPMIERRQNIKYVRDTFSVFVEQFQEPLYNGLIPVLIADQDMHRLAVAIASRGFIVSELNPADSHGVFGEYWQNRGPAVEEKLALTTVGLLVQHHIFNPNVLDPKNYYVA